MDEVEEKLRKVSLKTDTRKADQDKQAVEFFPLEQVHEQEQDSEHDYDNQVYVEHDDDDVDEEDNDDDEEDDDDDDEEDDLEDDDEEDDEGDEDEQVNLEAIYSVQKMSEVLKTGSDAEKEFVLFELRQLLDHCFQDTLDILVPVICRFVSFWSTEIQFKVAEALLLIVSRDIPSSAAILIANSASKLLCKSKSSLAQEDKEIYFDVWGDILLEVIPDIEFTENIRENLLQLTIDLANSNDDFRKRLAARLAGTLTQVLRNSEYEIENVLFPIVLDLAMANNIVVRGTAGEALSSFGAILHETVVVERIWPILVKFLSEDDFRVPGTALRTISTILREQRAKDGPKILFTELLPPVMDDWSAFAVQQATKDQRTIGDDMYTLLSAVSEEIGELIYSLWLYNKDVNMRPCLKAFFKMSICNGPLIRRNCAYNIPGISHAFAKTNSKEMCDLLEFFSRDGDDECRWNAASGLHETIKILVNYSSDKSKEKLLKAFKQSIQDSNPLVRQKVLENMADIVESFHKGHVTSFTDFAPAFLNLKDLSEGAWRIQQDFCEQLAKCIQVLPPNLILDNIFPILYSHVALGAPLVRKVAVVAIIRGFRVIDDIKLRTKAIKTFWKRLKEETYLCRVCMIDGGVEAVKVFSSKRFEQNFARTLLSLANDTVVNVRLKLARELPLFASKCVNQAPVERALRILHMDTDKDVRETLETYPQDFSSMCKIHAQQREEDEEKFRVENEFWGEEKTSEKKRKSSRMLATAQSYMSRQSQPKKEVKGIQGSISLKDIMEQEDNASDVAKIPVLPENRRKTQSVFILDGVLEGEKRNRQTSGDNLASIVKPRSPVKTKSTIISPPVAKASLGLKSPTEKTKSKEVETATKSKEPRDHKTA